MIFARLRPIGTLLMPGLLAGLAHADDLKLADASGKPEQFPSEKNGSFPG